MKLIITDPHITEQTLLELEGIFNEIYQQEADELIMLGDYYNKKKPNAREILFGTKWAVKFKEKYKKVIFLRGNHDKTQDISAIDYLQYLGIKVVDNYVDENNNFYGHFMLNESKFAFGTGKCGIKDLAHYNMVFLGHQHSFQEIAGHIWHIGSVRYVGFGEVCDKSKYILKLAQKPEFIQLHTPIPMVDVKSVKELPNINPKTKVRCLVTSFDQFKREINEISKWKDKFAEFKLKLEFGDNPITTSDNKDIKREKKNLQQLITQYIEKIEDKDVKELLKKQIENK